jgi:hypothetical protein
MVDGVRISRSPRFAPHPTIIRERKRIQRGKDTPRNGLFLIFK